jgi:CheY-like chemotaxis protein
VLISDIEMLREDGYAFFWRLRTLAAGCSMHVPKPVDPTELAIIVADLAGRT